MKFYILFGLSTLHLVYGWPTSTPLDQPIRPERSISTPGATRAVARFGPFKLPSSKTTGMMGMSGVNTESRNNVELPCKGCTYTYIKGDMVYKNGTSANIVNGAYMHHITLFDVGAGQSNLLLALLAGAKAGGNLADVPSLKPLYLAGNERLPITFPQAGVYMSKNASVMLNVLLQNFEATEKEVFIDMDYDYLPGQPAGYRDITPVPQDALGMENIMGTIKQSGVWQKTSPKYTVSRDARVLMMYGHVHDGGINTEIMINGKVTCNSTAYYQDMKIPANQTTTAAEGGHGHSMTKRDGGNSHIVAFGECPNVGEVKKGDFITTKVYYDFTKRPATPMANGREDALMGISMTFLGTPMPKD